MFGFARFFYHLLVCLYAHPFVVVGVKLETDPGWQRFFALETAKSVARELADLPTPFFPILCLAASRGCRRCLSSILSPRRGWPAVATAPRGGQVAAVSSVKRHCRTTGTSRVAQATSLENEYQTAPGTCSMSPTNVNASPSPSPSAGEVTSEEVWWSTRDRARMSAETNAIANSRQHERPTTSDANALPRRTNQLAVCLR
ncbi:unnamed protein product [Protopolystoma xenopodis]|uniref:Secreted protein n=1 Tax=Protopolystoma xenopodis TaxID=117903 RepID=A0A448X5E3_9PLAT|nr:unnamed protein product [Protopolystoma xenopodis]